MTPEQRKRLLNACADNDEVRIITCALHIAATAARERKQDVAIAIRHLVDAHQNREHAEKAYREQRRVTATAIMAGLVANPGGPFQGNDRSGWGLVNCDDDQVAGVAVGLADSLLAANARAPIPQDAEEPNPEDRGPAHAGPDLQPGPDGGSGASSCSTAAGGS